MELDGHAISIKTIRENIRNYKALTQCEMLFLFLHASEEEVFEILLLISHTLEVLQRNMTEILLSSPRR